VISNSSYVLVTLPSPRIPGSTASFTCMDGFYANGITTTTCQLDLSWDNPLPQCQRISCGPLPEIQNGSAVLMNGTTLYEDLAGISCDIGLSTPNDILECLASGTWDATGVICSPVQCSTLDAPLNGSLIAPIQPSYQDVATFFCDADFNLVGNANLTCTGSGVWDNPVPVCELKGNTEFKLLVTKGSSKILFECNNLKPNKKYLSLSCDPDKFS